MNKRLQIIVLCLINFVSLEAYAQLNIKLFKAVEENNLEAVRLALSKGIDVNAKDAKGWTALMHAAYKGQIEIAKLLIEKGAKLDEKNNDGKTALNLAREQKNTEMKILLIEKGASATEDIPKLLGKKSISPDTIINMKVPEKYEKGQVKPLQSQPEKRGAESTSGTSDNTYSLVIDYMKSNLQARLTDSTSLTIDEANCIKEALDKLSSLSLWMKFAFVSGLRGQTTTSSGGTITAIYTDRLQRVYYAIERKFDFSSGITTNSIADESGKIRFRIVESGGTSAFVIPHSLGNIFISCKTGVCICMMR